MLRDRELVLADTSMFCRFADNADGAALQAILEHFGHTLAICTDVHRELSGHIKGAFPVLAQLQWVERTGEFTRREPIALSAAMQGQVHRIAEGWRRAKGHYTAHEGEIATVLLAKEMGCVAVVDENDGRKLARQRNVTTVTTQDVVAEMVATNSLASATGEAVYCAVFHGSTSAAFQAAVQAAGT